MKYSLNITSIKFVLSGFGILGASLALTGCPAGSDMVDPMGTGGGDSVVEVCDPKPIFATNCQSAICHGGNPGASPAGSVELIADGFEANLVNVPATYANVLDPSACPNPPEMLINSASPGDSLMITKLNGMHSCGEAMPVGVELTADQVACIEEWVFSKAAGN